MKHALPPLALLGQLSSATIAATGAGTTRACAVTVASRGTNPGRRAFSTSRNDRTDAANQKEGEPGSPAGKDSDQSALRRGVSTASASQELQMDAGDLPLGAEQKERGSTRKPGVLESDELLRLKMEDLAGDGGEAGVELENGKAVAMKRGVRDNMFRVI